MKLKIRNVVNFASLAMMACGMAVFSTGCDDFDLYKTEADYNPRYKGTVEGMADYSVDAAAHALKVTFKSDMDWTAQVMDSQGEACSFASVSPESGVAGEECEVTVSIDANEDIENNREIQLQIITEKGGEKTILIVQEYKVLYLAPEDIPDYGKYICPGAWNPHFEEGPEYMLRHDAYYSWHRSKQSEHFVVFWSPEFGADPNAESVTPAMRVDIDDLLEKAEHFFDTNVNKLGMATLGQGKSMLDNYKMQIYLIYQDEWLATGSGYDDKIGALWVNPSTCQPVGSTIAHEIGHSFQYQTYADRVNCQGAAADGRSGFRYGYVGPLGEGNGGCAYWEQCAQWQAQRDYPNEQFESYNFQVWLNNCHRHFHHEWQRYASYWLQSYWVQKRGIEAYGRIWTESVAPEDAIMAYTRIFNNGDYQATREELADYALRMATFDLEGMPSIYKNYLDLYEPTFYYDDENGFYQVGYGSCPGSTGFNVISLNVPAGGGTVSVDFHGLEYGAPLHKKDKGRVVDGDGNAAGKATNYNAVGGEENMGWRYGFVAYSVAANRRKYSEIKSDKDGTLSFTVPAGIDYLYLVVQGSPEQYFSHGWDEVETNDVQFPYTIKLTGTDLKYYEEEVEPEYEVVDAHNMNVTFAKKFSTPGIYQRGTLDLAAEPIANFLGVSADEMSGMLQVNVEPAEGVIAVQSINTDGSVNTAATANNGYWLDADGNTGAWGGGYIYFEIAGTELNYGDHPSQITEGYTGSHTMRPRLVYTKGGETYTVNISITLNY